MWYRKTSSSDSSTLQRCRHGELAHTRDSVWLSLIYKKPRPLGCVLTWSAPRALVGHSLLLPHSQTRTAWLTDHSSTVHSLVVAGSTEAHLWRTMLVSESCKRFHWCQRLEENQSNQIDPRVLIFFWRLVMSIFERLFRCEQACNRQDNQHRVRRSVALVAGVSTCTP